MAVKKTTSKVRKTIKKTTSKVKKGVKKTTSKVKKYVKSHHLKKYLDGAAIGLGALWAYNGYKRYKKIIKMEKNDPILHTTMMDAFKKGDTNKGNYILNSYN